MILDWTEAALARRVLELWELDRQEDALLTESMLELYQMGEVEVVWSDGYPKYRFLCDIDPPPEDLLRDD